MKYAPPLRQPSTIDTGTICYDCNFAVSGRCWRHQTVTIVPTIVRPLHTFTPYEHDRTTGASLFPIMGDLVTETGPLLR